MKGAAAKHLWSLYSTLTKHPLGGGRNILSEEEDLDKTSSPRRIRVPILFFSSLFSLLSSFLYSQLCAITLDRQKPTRLIRLTKTRAMVFMTMPIIILVSAISRDRRPASNLARNNRSGPFPGDFGTKYRFATGIVLHGGQRRMRPRTAGKPRPPASAADFDVTADFEASR